MQITTNCAASTANFFTVAFPFQWIYVSTDFGTLNSHISNDYITNKFQSQGFILISPKPYVLQLTNEISYWAMWNLESNCNVEFTSLVYVNRKWKRILYQYSQYQYNISSVPEHKDEFNVISIFFHDTACNIKATEKKSSIERVFSEDIYRIQIKGKPSLRCESITWVERYQSNSTHQSTTLVLRYVVYICPVLTYWPLGDVILN